MSEYEALYDLFQALDLGFVEKRLVRSYGKRSRVGRPHRNLLGMFKAELIKRLRRIESYAEPYRLLEADDVLRSLCIIREDEKPYHPSILLRFRRRIGPECFQSLVNRLVKQLDRIGILDSETLVLDATFIKAYSQRDPRDNSRGYSDSEARLRKQARNVVLGYGVHLAVDAGSEMPLAVTVEPANVNEKKAAPLLLYKAMKNRHRWKSLVADSQYSSEAFRIKARRRGVETVIPYPRNQMRGKQVLRIDRKFRSYGPSRLRRLYRKKSAVERVVSRLKTHYGLCQLRTRGLRNVLSHVLLCLLALLATALSAIKHGHTNKMRSPVQLTKLTGPK
ncbi:transposase [Candidatus Bathyarchaeota archaeon]|nr:transposase [Candidatus Bathyarchaeota archaeon]